MVRNQSRVPSRLSRAFGWTEEQEKIAFNVMAHAKAQTLRIDTPVFRYTLKDHEGKELQVAIPSDIPLG